MEYYGVYDLRELIEILINKGYNGWITSGSIGSFLYEDYAVFNDELLSDTIVSASFKINDDGKWSEFIPISDVEESILKQL